MYSVSVGTGVPLFPQGDCGTSCPKLEQVVGLWGGEPASEQLESQ